jgi:hypothetical protein
MFINVSQVQTLDKLYIINFKSKPSTFKKTIKPKILLSLKKKLSCKKNEDAHTHTETKPL